MGTLNVRGISPEIAGLIHQHKQEHAHKNVTQAVECIVLEWAKHHGLKVEAEEKKKKELIQLLENAESSIHELRLTIDTTFKEI